MVVQWWCQSCFSGWWRKEGNGVVGHFTILYHCWHLYALPSFFWDEMMSRERGWMDGWMDGWHSIPQYYYIIWYS